MKKFLKIAGPIAAAISSPLAMLFILIAFILQMATPGIHVSGSVLGLGYSGDISGTSLIFGNSDSGFKLSWSALIAWILLILTFLALLALLVFEIIKFAGVEKFAKKLNISFSVLMIIIRLAISALLIIASVFIFIGCVTFCSANGFSGSDMSLGVGWIFAGILAILAAVVAPIPSFITNIVGFIGGLTEKKK